MSDMPKSVHIYEQVPREGFQFEKRPIPTARKIELVDALSLDRLIEAAWLVEDIVGHPLPGQIMRGGTLRALREKARAAA
jgi:hypothetical protein